MLNFRLNKESIKCNLKCNNNYFTTSSSNSKHFWRGFYKCITCKATFVAIIKEVTLHNDVVINLEVNNVSCKEQKEIKIRINSDVRKELAKDLMIKGTLVVKSENIIFNLNRLMYLIFNQDNLDNIQSIFISKFIKFLYFVINSYKISRAYQK